VKGVEESYQIKLGGMEYGEKIKSKAIPVQAFRAPVG
jgi:hypothetical protein